MKQYTHAWLSLRAMKLLEDKISNFPPDVHYQAGKGANLALFGGPFETLSSHNKQIKQYYFSFISVNRF